MRTFIAHFLAKRTLEDHTGNFFEEVSLSIMVSNRSPRMSLSWSDVEGILLNAMSSGGVDHHLDPQTVIHKLKERVQTTKVDSNARKGDVIKTFQAIVNGEENNGFSVGLHAEMILATAGSEDFRKILVRNGDKEFETLCEVRRLILTAIYSANNRVTRQQDVGQNLDEISLSRLCCPVCLEYFKVSKDAAHINPILPGSHPNLCAVELPSCTPTNIVKAMVERFRHDLRNELKVLAISNRVSPAQNQGMNRRGISSFHSQTGYHRQAPSFDSQAPTGFKRLFGQANPFKWWA